MFDIITIITISVCLGLLLLVRIIDSVLNQRAIERRKNITLPSDDYDDEQLKESLEKAFPEPTYKRLSNENEQWLYIINNFAHIKEPDTGIKINPGIEVFPPLPPEPPALRQRHNPAFLVRLPTRTVRG